MPSHQHRKEGAVDAILRPVRRCCGKLTRTATPEPAPEVVELLALLKLTPRHVRQLYRTFLELKQHDPLTMTCGPHEASCDSMALLVRTKREWVEKIVDLLLELAGYNDVLPWDGFLFVFLQFCTLSKLELCQVMFYVIAKEMKSWSLSYLTAAQLEEFYDDFVVCPIEAFNTAEINFAKMTLARYSMTDFIELLYRYSQLINPCMHLQRSLQQALPSLSFWTNCDNVVARNRRIGVDFFRYHKISSIMDVMTEKTGASISAASVIVPETQKGLLFGPEQQKAIEEKRARDIADAVRSRPDVPGTVPLPLGQAPPPRPKRPRPKLLPAWLENLVMGNEDPVKGTALGSAAAPSPRVADRAALEVYKAPTSVEEAHALIEATFGAPPVRATAKVEYMRVRTGRPTEERGKLVERAKELDFVQRSRHGLERRDNLVDIMSRACPCELIDRPVKKVQGHL